MIYKLINWLCDIKKNIGTKNYIEFTHVLIEEKASLTETEKVILVMHKFLYN